MAIALTPELGGRRHGIGPGRRHGRTVMGHARLASGGQAPPAGQLLRSRPMPPAVGGQVRRMTPPGSCGFGPAQLPGHGGGARRGSDAPPGCWSPWSGTAGRAHWGTLGHRAPVCPGQQRIIRIRERPGRRLVASLGRRSGARWFRALITGAIKWGDANFVFEQLRRLRAHTPWPPP
jgi:hypothetical protein